MAAGSDMNSTDDAKIRRYLEENLADLSHVYAAHKKSLETCEDEVAQWKKFIKDYNVLQEKLTTFPDKTSYETMVPIGSLAFMHGQTIHTNEILVHLGENWFADRSVKDAIEIIKRRKEVCMERLKAVEALIKTHAGWLKQTKELVEKEGNHVEILEELSEEEYAMSKEKHKEMVEKHFALPVEDKSDQVEASSLVYETKTFEELMKRLDALEEEEKLKDELAELETDGDESQRNGNDFEESERVEKDDDYDRIKEEEEDNPSIDKGGATKEGSKESENPTSPNTKEKLRRRVSWAEHLIEPKDDFENDDVSPDTIKIKYRSRQQSLPSELIASQDEDSFHPSLDCNAADVEESNDTQTPQSPSDLYSLFGTLASSEPRPKGILKKKGESFSAEDTEKGVGWLEGAQCVKYIPSSPDDNFEHLLPLNPPLSESPREIKNLKPAFSYKVIARDNQTDFEEPSVEKQVGEEEPKKISHFKASRMNK